jgi:hypothetical protein
MAGDEISFFMSPPHFGQTLCGGSESFWMISSRSWQF